MMWGVSVSGVCVCESNLENPLKKSNTAIQFLQQLPNGPLAQTAVCETVEADAVEAG